MEKITDGIWERFIPGGAVYDAYKFAVTGPDGVERLKADPYGGVVAGALIAPAGVIGVLGHRQQLDEVEAHVPDIGGQLPGQGAVVDEATSTPIPGRGSTPPGAPGCLTTAGKR